MFLFCWKTKITPLATISPTSLSIVSSNIGCGGGRGSGSDSFRGSSGGSGSNSVIGSGGDS